MSSNDDIVTKNLGDELHELIRLDSSESDFVRYGYRVKCDYSLAYKSEKQAVFSSNPDCVVELWQLD